MKKVLSGLCATALAATMALSGAIPASAVPAVMPERIDAVPAQIAAGNGGSFAGADIVQVQGRDWRRDGRHFRGGREFRGNRHGFYRGYRGYRDYRPGYRRHGDFWFPAAAFLAGALVTGAIQNSGPRYVEGGGSHVRWCYNRYKSYRASDNTFQPYNGPRQQCYSPYD